MSESAAAMLDARTPQLLSRYECRLRKEDSSLVASDDVRRDCLRNAGRIVADCVRSLRRGSMDLDEESLATAVAPGVDRAARGFHKQESLRAAEILFDLVLDALLDVTAGDVERARPAIQALHHSIMARVAGAAAAHDSELLRMIQEVQATLRRQFARDLHDTFGSEVALLLRLVELLREDLGPSPAASRLDRMEALARRLAASARGLIDTGRPAPVGELASALQEYAASTGMDDLRTAVCVRGDERWIPDRLRQELFLVVREALGNALRHSGSSTLTAAIDVAPFSTYAVIEDQGRGFDHDGAVLRSGASHGLTFMQERMTLHGGKVLVTSRPRQGTRIEVWLPYRAARTPPQSRPRVHQGEPPATEQDGAVR